ncbi:hypothetical protein AD428_11215 [Achromobacter sp. DMS1]|nr:hypothetical protein AD428_11215 [Achromobacter sp. DMS1]
MGQHRAVEHRARAGLHQQSGEVLHVFLAQQFFMVFDVYPCEDVLRQGVGKCLETGAVLSAGIAPGGTETRNEPGIGRSEAIAQGAQVGAGNE